MMQAIYGRPVQISEACPRMQVSEAFKRLQSPELVAETNAWMAGFFGHTELMANGEIFELYGHTLVMNRATYNKVVATMAATQAKGNGE
jgi:hypothetical protein